MTTPTLLAMADHYAVLGVQPDADRTAIQAAYRMLARLHHPDFGGDGSRMAALNEAWSVLGKVETRLAYDAAPLAERSAWGAKVRQLEGLVEYAATWL